MSSTAHFNTASHNVSPLTLSGSNGYSIQGDRVILSVSEIANHRNFDNSSGSLSLELWALNRPYFGGHFDGVPLAGTQIGCVQGQHLLVNGQYDLPFTAPGAGSWILTLMLREWDGQGYVTRDHVSFAQPYVVERKAVAAVQAQADNVITVNFAAAEPRAEAGALPAGEPAAKVQPKAPVTAKVKSTAKADVKADVKASKKAAAKAPASPVVDARLSLNEASPAEIAAIKGVSTKLADAIVAARPFISVDALLAVKGMGPKLLDKLRPLVRL